MKTSSVYDDVVRGLHLRSGARKQGWYLYYRTKQGKERRPKLGDHPSLSLAEARKAARLILARVAIGEDPADEWKRKRGETTVGELFKHETEGEHGYWNDPRLIRSGRTREVHRYWLNTLWQFGNDKLTDVTTAHVKAWHRGLRETPFHANRALEILSRLFAIAVEQELVRVNPCTGVRRYPEPVRERYATPQEIRDIAAVMRRYADEYPRQTMYMLLLMLTGSRPKFLQRAKREDLRGNILVGVGKTTATTGRKDAVAIPDWAVRRVLEQLPVRDDGLLIGPVSYRSYWARICREANVPNLWVRDWRRTYATLGLSSGLSLTLVGELLNHADPRSTKVYAKLLPDSRRDAAERVGARMRELLEE